MRLPKFKFDSILTTAMYRWLKSGYARIPLKNRELDFPESSTGEEAQGPLRKAHFLLGAVSSLALIVIIFELLMIIDLHKSSSHFKNMRQGYAQMVERRYGASPTYQSLDHKFDGLWNETDTSSIILSSRGMSDGKEDIGAISM